MKEVTKDEVAHYKQNEALIDAKPIAWMASNELLFSAVKDEIYHIPLYTHPMHELTMNPDILPTLEEWKLICEMVKKWKK